MRRDSFPFLSSFMAMLAVAYLFAPSAYWRSPLTFLLFLWSVATAIGFARGREAETVVDPRFPARLPLRRPARIRGAREIALAAVTGALAVFFGVHLFAPAPKPVETQPAQEETAAPDSVESPADSAGTKESPVAESPVAESPVAMPPVAAPEACTARAGDTFKSIARRIYGDASKAADIARANPDIRPNARLRAGRKINLPKPEKPPGD